MDKEKIFSKLNSKDYNNELEKILEEKNFSENVKNLLLSMLYKIEAGYKDYVVVKRVVENKKAYIEEILKIIKDKCNKIEIVKEGSEEIDEIKKRKSNFLVNKIDKTINLIYPNEKILLYTIYKLDDIQVYLDEKYNLIRNSLSELLNAGENINNIEVLRDFNGWSWNTESKEIQEITTNVVYQNLVYLLGIELIKQWVHTNEVNDYIEIVEKNLIKLYGENITKSILELIYKISIIICVQKNQTEKKRLLDEKEQLQNEINRLNDKTSLLNEISQIKKEALKEIGNIDTIINDKQLLEKEYINRNEKRAEYNKIFSLSHLSEILLKQRKKAIMQIEEANKLLDPTGYVKTKQNIQNQLNLLIDIEAQDNRENIKYNYIIKLQKLFLECFLIKVDQVKEKEQIIELIYMFRYYNYIYINDEKQIKDIKELNILFKKIKNYLLKRAYELKIINKITDNEELNNKIINNIFTTKMITLENINIELKIENENLIVEIYDIDILEQTIKIEKFDKENKQIKLNKKIKLFI